MRIRIFAALLALAACEGQRTSDKAMTSDGADRAGPAPPVAAPGAARPRGAAERAVAAGAAANSAAPSLMVAQGPQAAQAPGQVQPQDVSQATIAPTMLIRTGDAWIEVRELDAAVEAVRRLATSVGGYVAGTQVRGGREEVRSATLEVKVPAQRFDQAVSGLTGIGKVESVNIAAQDVGEEFTDLTARVANARRLEERLLDLLARRTGRLEDVLAVERELSRIREEIERIEGRLRYLRTRAAVSTLTITVHEPHPVLGGPGHSPIADAFRDAWRNFVGFVAGLIASLGVLIPIGAIVAGLVWLVRRMGWFRRGPSTATTPTVPTIRPESPPGTTA